MIRLKTAIAAAVALAACVNAALLAADTNTTVALISPKINAHLGGATLAHGWYGPGWDGGFGYFNPARSDEYDPYPYYNIVGGESYGPLYQFSLPDQNESPFNPPAALTRHGLMVSGLMQRPVSLTLSERAAQAVPPRTIQDVP